MEQFDALAPGRTPTGPSVTVASWPSRAALACAALAGALLVLPFGLSGNAAGYALAAILVPVFAVAHRLSAEQRRSHPKFVNALMPARVLGAALILGLALGLAHAWLVATELAKL